MSKKYTAWLVALAVPIFYLFYYTPFGMDGSDFGYFYAYAWRVLQGQMPYQDFFYIKPCLPLYWHAFWLWLTPEQWQILGGKIGFCLTILVSAWLAALYFNRLFKFSQIGLPLLATCGFVFSIHSFPHMPWHTADGALFCAAGIYLAACDRPALAGLLIAFAVACKQSFALMPLAVVILLWLLFSRRRACIFLCSCLAVLIGFCLWLKFNSAWPAFRAMTTGQLDIQEALDAGIFIYIRQNWLLPLFAVSPALISALLKKRLPCALQPGYCYLTLVTGWTIYLVYSQKTWVGFGISWPTLFMLLAVVAILWPRFFLTPLFIPQTNKVDLTAAAALAAPILASWSVAISGGYKIPALFATPLIFAFLIFHARFYGSARKLAWLTLASGLCLFGVAYQYPYVFPVRPLTRNDFQYDAGAIYPQATGVVIDKDMYERLEELKTLRSKYGPAYKTMPAFSFDYFLNRDYPAIASDWLIDWEINGDTDRLYNELLEKNITVFMERDQLEAKQADAYERAGYSVPQRVVKLWRKVDETPHFVVFQKP